MFSSCLLLASSLSVSPASAENGAIGLYFDSDCATCSQDVTVGVPFTLYVNATLAGGTAQGILRAEFSIGGLPSGWLTQSTPNPLASNVRGDPFGSGASISFDRCITTTQLGCVHLYTIWVLPTTPADDLRLRIQANFDNPICSPTLPPWNCRPILVACDPLHSGYLVSGGQAILNGPACTVAVDERTWSDVRQLYRH